MYHKTFKTASTSMIIVILLSLFVFSIESSIAQDLNDTLQKLKSRNPGIRIDAAVALGEAKDPRAIRPLITVLKKDRDGDVRGAAEDALVNIGTPAVNSLIPLLEDQQWRVRRRAVRTIGRIKDSSAIGALIQASGTDTDCCVRRFAAQWLGEIKDDRAAQYLHNAARTKKIEIVKGAYRFFMRRGESGTESILIEALHMSFDRNMINDFVNCGNHRLKEAALKYAEGRYAPKISTDWKGPRWGQDI